jgi:hypothetical protein
LGLQTVNPAFYGIFRGNSIVKGNKSQKLGIQKELGKWDDNFRYNVLARNPNKNTAHSPQISLILQ